MDDQNKNNDRENKTEPWSEEELQRDVERRKMLIIFCVVFLVLFVHLSIQSDEIYFTVEVLLNQERDV